MLSNKFTGFPNERIRKAVLNTKQLTERGKEAFFEINIAVLYRELPEMLYRVVPTDLILFQLN